jgi:hypothetical protein
MRLYSVILLLAVGCAGLQDVMTLANSIRQRYQVPANVNINNGTHLIITFANLPPSVTADSVGRAVFAHDVAEFAEHQYREATKLEDVTIGFSKVSSIGPITVSRTEAPYRWTVAELRQ